IAGVDDVRASATTGRVLVTFRDPSARAEVLGVLEEAADAACPPAPTVRRSVALAARRIGRMLERARAHAMEGAAAGPATPHEQAEPGHARDAGDVARLLDVAPAVGLDTAVAAARRRELGANVFTDVKTRTRGEILAEQVLTVPAALLGGAVALSALL